MKKIELLALFLSLFGVFAEDNVEYFSIVGPRFIKRGEDLEVFLTTTNISASPTELEIVLFTQKPRLEVGKVVISIPAKKQRIKFNLKSQPAITNYTLIAGIPKRNFLKSMNIYGVDRDYSVLIQTDKDVYKAGDEVHFRVLAVDYDTRPYQFELMLVLITDAKRNVFHRVKQPKVPTGAYEGSFMLSDEPLNGKWGLHVKIDNDTSVTRKNFEVRDYQLPTFEAVIDTSPVVTLNDTSIKVTVYGRYNAGQYVKGMASLDVKIFKADNKTETVHQAQKLVKSKETWPLNMVDTLKIDKDENKPTIVEFTLRFEDELTKKSMTTSKNVTVNGHNEEFFFFSGNANFKPGIPYKLSFIVSDLNGQTILESDRNVSLVVQFYEKLRQKCDASENTDQFMLGGIEEFSAPIKNGIAEFTVETREIHNAMDFEVEFGRSLFFRTIFRAPSKSWHYVEANIMSQSLTVGKEFKVQVQSSHELSSLSAVVIGQKGLVYSEHFNIDADSKIFNFGIVATSQMRPEATLFVFYHEETGEIVHDRVILRFDDSLPNKLEISVPEGKLSPGDESIIHLNSSADSTVYLSAVDVGATLLKPKSFSSTQENLRKLLKNNRYENFEKPSKSRYPEFMESNAFIITNAYKGAYDCSNVRLSETKAGPVAFPSNFETPPAESFWPRKEFPETWFFESFKVNSKGVGEVRKKAPDSLTSWMISGISISPTLGLGATEPKKLQVTKPFFIHVDFPHTIRLGEIVKIDISAFNYLESGRMINVDLTFFNSEREFEFVTDICKLKANKQLMQHRKFQVNSNSGHQKSFNIRPLNTGHIKLRIKAVSAAGEAGDEVERLLYVQSEGVTQYNSKMVMIDVRTNKFYSFYLPFEIDPKEAMRNSYKVGATAYGNLMKPISMQSSGKNKMTRFVSSLFNIEYLNSIGKLSDDKREELMKSVISPGYQDLLKVKDENGSLGTVWLTAFTAKFLSRAKNWMEIEEDYLVDALNHLSSKQRSTGGFREEEQNKDNIALTAYATIAVLENGNYIGRFNKTIQKSLEFLNANRQEAKTNYELAVVAYTLALAEHPNTDLLLEELKGNAIIENNEMHWNIDSSNARNESLTAMPEQIEIASYALLAFLKAGKKGDALPILRWLVGALNAADAYSKSDAVVIQAMSAASIAFYTVNSNIKITLVDSKEKQTKLQMLMHIDSAEAFVEKEVQLPSYTNEVSIMSTGSGFAALKIWWQYDTRLSKVTPVFKVTIEVKNTAADDVKDLKICANIIRRSGFVKSDLAVIEAHTPSGYEFHPDLKKFLEKANIQRYELRERKTVAIIFFPNVTSASKCVDIAIVRKKVVSNLKDAFVKVFDFYEPEKLGVAPYRMDSTGCVAKTTE